MKRLTTSLAIGLLFAACDSPTGLPEPAVSTGGAASAESYQAYDLGALGPGTSISTAINGRGEIVGFSDTGTGATHAFLWRRGEMIDLGTLGGIHSFAYGINARGVVVGMSYTATGEEHAFVWENGVMRSLDVPGQHSLARAINGRGLVVGLRHGHGPTLWEDGVPVDLGFQGPAVAISPNGWVAGTSYAYPGADPRAVLWRDGKLTVIGEASVRTTATGVNHRGTVVGIHIFTGGAQAVRWVNGRMRDLGTLGGPYSRAYGINSRGQIVGSSDRHGLPRPFLWENGVMTELPTLGGDGFANAINRDGQIVGYSWDGVNYRATLYQKGGTPPPTPPVDDIAPSITGLQPDPAITGFVLNPDANGDGTLQPGDYVLAFDAFDPPLPGGSPGSGVDETGCAAGGPCANISATVLTGPGGAPGTFAVENRSTPVSTNPDFFVQMHSPLAPEGDYVIDIIVPDHRTNVATATYRFSLDKSDPVYGPLFAFPVDFPGTDAQAVVTDMGGTIADANVIEFAKLGVYVDGTDRFGTGADGVCDSSTDYLLNAAAGEIDQNVIDHTNGTSSISYRESFLIPEPDTAARTITYCYIHQARDGAKTYDGVSAPNFGVLRTQSRVVWNAG
ncbi:MAG: hypothetical protein OEU54_09595 [Gemmatimonadota bacterium]|nr:hypothetical protein [Gemmatimonadota bacterium]